MLDYARIKESYGPAFSVHSTPLRPSTLKGNKWNDILLEYTLVVFDSDLDIIRARGTTSDDLQQIFAFMSSEAKRNAEVTLRHLNASERKEFEAAKDKELDQWVSHAVFKVARRAGIPLSRIMPMRWVLTWKEA